MDGQKFDELVKQFCTTRLTRLSALRGLVAGAAAAVTGSALATDDADAKGKKGRGAHSESKGKGRGAHSEGKGKGGKKGGNKKKGAKKKGKNNKGQGGQSSQGASSPSLRAQACAVDPTPSDSCGPDPKCNPATCGDTIEPG